MKQADDDRITLEAAVDAVREDEAPRPVAAAAAARVWERVAAEAGIPAGPVEAIRGCADIQSLLPGYREGTLPQARTLLVEDHLRECAVCRSAMRPAGPRRLAVLPWRPTTADARPRPRRLETYAIAASVLLATVVAAAAVHKAFFAPPPGSRASVQSVSGTLHRVAEQQTQPLLAGAEVNEGETVRTARGGQTVLRLRDGSLVEVGERSELFVTARGNDTTIHLERGRIIVQAAKRRVGHLLVASKDCTVMVTGTVFSVNRGLKGSRVSVIEGQVRVVRGGDEEVLAPGQQWATPAMGNVPVKDEIAWSREVDRHLALLGALKELRETWDAVPTPGLRTESRLLGLVPADAVVFASLPNYGDSLAEAHRLFEERLRESPVLQRWWQEADPAAHGGPSLASLIEKVHGFSRFLDDEIAFVVLDGGALRRPLPIVLARVRQPGLQEFLDREVPSHQGLSVRVRPDLVAVSPDRDALSVLDAKLDGGAAGLAGTPFGARIRGAYRDGVGLLFAADLERIAAAARKGHEGTPDAQLLARSGFDGARYLVVERRGLTGDTRAVLAFAGARRGLASWLAPPAPMGALEFVSPNAQVVGAFVFKSPSLVLDDILDMARLGDARSGEKVAELEAGLSLHLREDLAETLGGEFALALDGPLLPVPAWKLVVEVEDPARLQSSLQVLVERASDEALRAQRPALRLEAEQAGERTYYAVRGGGLPFEVHYAFADGYLVGAPSRALVMRAIQTRESGDSLGQSPGFQALFPRDRHANVSGLVYQDFGPLVGALLDAKASLPLAPAQRGAVESLARDAKPTLLCAYGEEDAIQVAGTGGLFTLDPTQMVLPLLLERAGSGTRGPAAP